ncbi:MAG: zf-HC2 domain-containing protein [Pseudomonadota bacterium]
MRERDSMPPGGIACHELRPLLAMVVDGEFEHGEQIAIDAHLAACADCAQQVLAQRHFKAQLSTAVRLSDERCTPPDLTRRIQRRARRDRSAHRAVRLAVPLGVTAAVIALFTVNTTNAVTPIVAESVERHTDNLVMDYASQDPLRIQRLLSRHLSHALEVPIFRSAKVSLRGARVVKMERQSAAYLVYGTPRSKISIIAVPDPQGRYNVDDERLPRPEGRPLLMERRSGFNVVVWRRHGTVYSMVSDLAPREMLGLLANSSEDDSIHAPAPEPGQAVPVVPVSF